MVLHLLQFIIIALFIAQSSESFSYQSHQRNKQKYTTATTTTLHIYRNKPKISSMEESIIERRYFLHSIISSILASTATVAHAASVPYISSSTSSSSTNSNITTQQIVQSLLRSVPVFTIVDTDGIPFMVVGEDAKISCYFFTTYSEADRLLSLAKNSVDTSMNENKQEKKEGEKESPEINPWGEAQISSVSLDFAVGLVQRGKVGGAYFYVAPADTDIQDALAQSPKRKELEEGKVPLFYMEDFIIQGKVSKQTPLYFRKEELLKAWRTYNPSSNNQDHPPPPIKVTELFAIIKLLSSSTHDDDDIRSITLIPPSESIQKAKDCQSRVGKNQAFQLGKRILVL